MWKSSKVFVLLSDYSGYTLLVLAVAGIFLTVFIVMSPTG